MVVGQLYNKYQIMKFKTLKTNLSNLKIKSYFKRFGLDEITKHKNFKKRKVNQMIDDFAFQPELDELYLLHRYIIQFRRMTILEFGIIILVLGFGIVGYLLWEIKKLLFYINSKQHEIGHLLYNHIHKMDNF